MTTTQPEVGTALTEEQVLTLPLFSTIDIPRHSRQTVTLTGLVGDSHRDGYYSIGQFTTHYGRPTLVSVGSVERALDTLDQFKQRFSTIAKGRAYNSSVSQHNVNTALRALRLPLPDAVPLRVGMWVHAADSETLGRLPIGTTLRANHPDYPALHIYGVVAEAYGVRSIVVAKGISSPYAVYEVLSFPEGTTTEAWREARPDEQERIALFKVTVHREGYQHKQSSSWCGDYENALGRMGITDAVVAHLTSIAAGNTATGPGAGPATGAVLNAEQIADLPRGSLVIWSVHHRLPADSWVMFVRDGSTDFAFCSTRIAGVGNTGTNASRAMLLRLGPDGAMHDWVVTHADMNAFPVGTVLAEGSARYVKRDDGRWSNTGLAWEAEQFVMGGIRLHSIPTGAPTEESEHALGSVLTPQQVAAMPEGSLFRRINRDFRGGEFTIYVRNDNLSTNSARVVVAFENRPGRNRHFGTSAFSSQMHLVRVGINGPVWEGFEIESVADLDAMPVGTTIRRSSSDRTKRADGQWQDGRMTVPSSQYNFPLSTVVTHVGPFAGPVTGVVMGAAVASHADMDAAPAGSLIRQNHLEWIKDEGTGWRPTTRSRGSGTNADMAVHLRLGPSFVWSRYGNEGPGHDDDNLDPDLVAPLPDVADRETYRPGPASVF